MNDNSIRTPLLVMNSSNNSCNDETTALAGDIPHNNNNSNDIDDDVNNNNNNELNHTNLNQIDDNTDTEVPIVIQYQPTAAVRRFVSVQWIVRTLFPWISITNNDTIQTSSNDGPSENINQPTTAAYDSLLSILLGITTLIVFGTIIGFVSYFCSSSSSNVNIISLCIGYIYFIMWSISFYPQVLSNIQYQTTNGVSIDFIWLNWIGFICYTTYNTSLYYNSTIQYQYKERHDDTNTSKGQLPVQPNDVAFAIHALLFCTLLLLQVIYYDGIRNLIPSRTCCYIILLIVLCITCYPIICFVIVPFVFRSTTSYQIIDYIYFLSYIKIGITCMKYIPQVYYNYKRSSTIGWNIWQIVLDLSGGIFSILQLLYDDHRNNNDSSGTSGGSSTTISNMPKFMLGNISIIFDIIFIVQHYVLYPPSSSNNNRNDTTILLYHAPMDEDNTMVIVEDNDDETDVVA